MAKNVVDNEDIFGGMFRNYEDKTVQTELEKQTDTVQKVSRKRLHSFKEHPFRVIEDEQMVQLADSIRQYGIQEPLLLRPLKENPEEYEIISGHRRNHAAGIAGLEEVPAYIRELDDDTATVLMVDANNKREVLLPSEKAWAYRMKADALRHQGKRNDLQQNEEDLGMKAVGKKNRDSVRTVQRYIRLTYLSQELLQLVDEEKLTITIAYTISFLNCDIQNYIVSYYQEKHILPDNSQAEAMQAEQERGMLDTAAVERIMSKHLKEKKPARANVTLKESRLRQYFPEGMSSKEMEEVIIDLLEKYAKKQ
uniref:ParB/RepB/Spo0J family partition protein n=1 Tax=Roseburia sp. TaxID=2049040 RepID=UPI003FF11ABB